MAAGTRLLATTEAGGTRRAVGSVAGMSGCFPPRREAGGSPAHAGWRRDQRRPSSSSAPGFSQCCPSGLLPALPGSSSSLRKVAGGGRSGGMRAGFAHKRCRERHRHGNVDGQAEVINSDTYYFN